MKTKWKKSPQALIDTFDAAIAGKTGVERRQMFGYPCAFLNGNMLTGLFEDRLMMRLSESDRAKAVTDLGARTFEPMKGRPMREYMELPAAVVDDRRKLGAWLKRAISYVETLPPKKPKKK